jgi:hypothetical protein
MTFTGYVVTYVVKHTALDVKVYVNYAYIHSPELKIALLTMQYE